MSIKGGCLCGHIRFVISAPLEAPHTCSCSQCRRHSGALTVAWVEVPSDAVTWTGPGGAPSTYRSSEASSRSFCPNCGSTIGAFDDAPVIAFATGALDNPSAKAAKPVSHSYQSARPRWWKVEVTE